MTVDTPVPTKRQSLLRLSRYAPKVVEQGIAALALKAERPAEEMTLEDKWRFASACMRDIGGKESDNGQ